MITLTGFADEISPDLDEQLNVLASCGVRHLELRSVGEKNVMKLSDAELGEVKAKIRGRGFAVSSIGSPIGKIPITDPFEPHLEETKRAVEIAEIMEAPYLRIFSFFMPEGGDPAQYRDEVLARLTRQLEAARGAPVILLHENEREIYGDTADRTLDILKELGPKGLAGCFDSANFIGTGEPDVWECWTKLREETDYFHVKDQVRATEEYVLAGKGDGEYPRILTDAIKRGYTGFVSLEPHLSKGGRFGGFTGPDLFPQAVAATRKIIEAAGGKTD